MGLTFKQIQELKASGKIRGFNDPGRSSTAIQLPNKKPAAYGWLDLNLQYWCNQNVLTLEKEYRFHTDRKWRFDYAVPAIKVAIEYEGIFTDGKSRHTNVVGYTADTDKYNAAAVAGWRVIRVTAKNYKTVLEQLNKMV